jgi:hypothetical protein
MLAYLPTEILYHLCTFLDKKELGIFGQLCYNFYLVSNKAVLKNGYFIQEDPKVGKSPTKHLKITKI